MKKIATLVLFLFALKLATAQKVTVNETTEIVEKISRTGLSTVIALDQKKVQKAWEKQLKNYGKITESKGIYTIPVANIPSISSTPCRVTSIVKSSGKGTMVWWAIDLGDEHVNSSSNSHAYKAAEKILSDFSMQCYREDVNDQIEEAEKALQNSVKTQEKKVKEGENLVRDVEKNKQEKINLEQKLKQNGEDLVQLQKDIETNKKDQAAATADVEKMKKALEVVKQKLNQIGQ